MTIDTDTYALLSQDSYKPHKLGQVVTIEGVAYKVIDQANDPVTGYQGAAYRRDDTGEVVIAHRGTEQIVRDGVLTDGGMVLTGVNVQTGDALAFTREVMEKAKRQAEERNQPLSITVTGHSLGGTLAEITACRYGLHGETFNAYGAAGLMRGIPEGGNQVINYVRATDVVSAASPHFGEVRIYATQQDIEHLRHFGYRDDSHLLSPRDLFGEIKTDAGAAHGIASFAPSNANGFQSIINPENAARYRANHDMIDRYRSDVRDGRIIVALASGAEERTLAVNGALALGNAGSEALSRVAHATEQAAHAVAQQAGDLYDATREKAIEGMHATERAVHHAYDATRQGIAQGVDATERAVTRGAQAAEGAAHHVYDATRQGIAQGVDATEHAVTQGVHATEHAAHHAYDATCQSLADGVHATEHALSEGVQATERAAHEAASRAAHAFDTLTSGKWFSGASVAARPRLDHPDHPDHALYQQARSGVHRLDAEMHRTPDQRSDNLAAALTVEARRNGLTRIDQVALSGIGERAFAMQHGAHAPMAHVQTADAVQTSIANSSAAWAQAAQQAVAVKAPLQEVQPPQQAEQAMGR